MKKLLGILVLGLILTGTSYAADEGEKAKDFLKSISKKSLTKKESEKFVLNYAITLKDERKDGIVTYIFDDENYERYKDFKAITKDAWRFSKLGALRLFNNDIKMTWKIKLGEVNEINIKTKFDPIGKLYEFTYQPKQEFLASVKEYEENKIAKKELEKQKEIAKQKKIEEEKKRVEEERLAAEQKLEEEKKRLAEERLAAEQKLEEEKKRLKEERLAAEQKLEEEKKRLAEERLEFEEQKKAEEENKELEKQEKLKAEIQKIASSKLKKLDNYEKSNEQLLKKEEEISYQLFEFSNYEFKDSKEINIEIEEGFKLLEEYKLALKKQKSQAIAEAAEVPYVETPIDKTIHLPLKNYVTQGERKIKKYQAALEKAERKEKTEREKKEKAEKKRIAEEKRKKSDELDKQLKEAYELAENAVKKIKESKKREKKEKNELEKIQKKRFKDIWTKIAYNYDNGDTVYVDFKNIKIESGFVYYWLLMDFEKPKEGNLSDKTFTKLDCSTFSITPLHFMYYTGNKGTGALDSQASLLREWFAIPPDTPLYDAAKKLCKNI